jgi:hypothetical protein
MQQPQVMTYAAIAEVRAVTGAAACNQLLADGWVLLGVYPITTVAEMTPREADGSSGNRISSAMSGGTSGLLWAGCGSKCISKRTVFDTGLRLNTRDKM